MDPKNKLLCRGIVLPEGNGEKVGRLTTCRVSENAFGFMNPKIETARAFTLRGSKAVKLAVNLQSEGTFWVHEGRKHGVLRFDIGNANANREMGVPNTVKQVLHTTIDNKPVSYTESQGIPTLRESVAGAFGVPIDDVFIVNGVTHALELTSLFFSNTGGHVVLTKPVYPPWAGILLLHGVYVKMASRKKTGHGKPDLESIKIESAGNCCGVVLISADNPTGLFLDIRTVEGVARLLQNQMVETNQIKFLIIDDIYLDQIPREKRIDYFAVSDAYGVPLIYMGGADKSIGTGFHGGHMIVHVPEILGGAREKILDSVNIIFAMFLGANTLTQHAMATYFDEYEKVRPEMDVNFGKFQNWSNMFRKSVEEVGLGYYFGAPDLPLYHFLELPPHIHSEDFAYELVRQHGIAVTPGAPFGVDGGIRIAMMRDPMAPVPIATIIKTLIQEWK